jgi:hypothetical protein
MAVTHFNVSCLNIAGEIKENPKDLRIACLRAVIRSQDFHIILSYITELFKDAFSTALVTQR